MLSVVCLGSFCCQCNVLRFTSLHCRHDHDTTQYRAVMPFNCRVDRSKPTRVGERTKAMKSKGINGGEGSKGGSKDKQMCRAFLTGGA